MKYELIKDANRGVIIDRTPILQDVRDTFEVSFLLPENGVYIAIFRDKDGTEYPRAIKDGKCKLPIELIIKKQRIEVLVKQIDDAKIIHVWECDSLIITALRDLEQRTDLFQVTAEITERDLLSRIMTLENRVNAIESELKKEEII